jgi:hypothetical protein
MTLVLYGAIGCLLCACAFGQVTEPGNDVPSCSPAPCVLPVTQVSQQCAVNADISVDPVNPKNLLLGSSDGSCGFSMTFDVSNDGGTTWTRSTCMGNIRTKRGAVYYPLGQPMAGYDLNGEAYIAGEYIDSEGVGDGLVVYQKSSDGVNWSQPGLALTRGYELLLYSWLAIVTNPQSPKANSLYVSSVAIKEPAQAGNQVFVAHSDDGGTHWFPVAVEPEQLYPASDIYTNVATAKDGTVYVTWQHCAAGGPAAGCKNGKAYMLFSKSTDGGNTWSGPIIIAKVGISPTPCYCSTGDLPNTINNIPVSNYPVIGVDNSNGPYSGNIYVAMYSWTGTYMQVQVVRSTDGGKTWSQPLPVAPPSATHDQFFPWLSVSSTGLVGVTWFDRRNDPANVKYQPFAAFSHDGGQSFGTNVVLNQKFSDPNIQNETYMGDYATNTWVGTNFLAAWMDSSNGVEMQDVVGGVRLR